MTNQGQRKKIAILGGGVGAMTAAYELTERPDVRDQLDITVYQLGWRLGGKGASGRNAAKSQRIEEHGLHVWFGFYENAFNLIQRCYDANAPLGPTPFPTWRDAFQEQSFLVWEDQINGEWVHHPITFPTNKFTPGAGERVLTAWQYVLELLKAIHEHFSASVGAKVTLQAPVAEDTTVTVETSVTVESSAVDLKEAAEDVAVAAAEGAVTAAAFAATAARAVIGGTAPLQPLWWGKVFVKFSDHVQTTGHLAEREALEMARQLAESLPADPAEHDDDQHQALQLLLGNFRSWGGREYAHLLKSDPELRRDWILLDLALAIVEGMLKDGIIFNGYNSINDVEFSQWLLTHGASQESVDSALIRVLYCLAFAFPDGDPDVRGIAAGTGLRAVLRLIFGYGGAIMWKMQAGMGDTIFTPLYDVLVSRGVKFKFFHRVTGLHPSNDGGSVDSITIGRQATPINGTYDPLVNIKGLRCWPSEPFYDQLEEGADLKTRGINLESAWTDWTDVEELTLTRGVDFDDIVLGISLGALPTICKDLIAVNADWQQMVEKVSAVRTQAFQVWMQPTIAQLGWNLGPDPVDGAYVEPLDTYADMSHLIDNEDWPDGNAPGSIAYFCGPMLNSPQPDFFTDPTFPGQMEALVKQNVLDFLHQDIGHLWPNGVVPGTPGLDFNLLVDPSGGVGEARLEWQFMRANIDPTELYVLSEPGSIQYRLPSDKSGFSNLYLAGDWTLNGLNAGCVEAAVMSGMQASRGICGFPLVVFGEKDL